MKSTSSHKSIFIISLISLIVLVSPILSVAQITNNGEVAEHLWRNNLVKWETNMLHSLSTTKEKLDSFLSYNNSTFLKDRGDFFAGVTAGNISDSNAELYFNKMKNEYIPHFHEFEKTKATQPNVFTTKGRQQSDPLRTLMACNTACDNIGFQNGTLSAWNAYYGVNSSSSTAFNITSITGGPAGSVATAAGPNPNTGNSYHATVFTGGGVDPVAGALIPLTPPLGGNCARIGDGPTAGFGVGQLQQSFVVSAASPILTLQYAVVLQNPGHGNFEQPFFKMELLDQNGVPVSGCGQYMVVAAKGLAGFKGVYYPATGDSVYCRGWTTAFVPLSNYVGQCLTLKLTAADCSQGGHFGYGYVAATCSDLKLVSSSQIFCNGQKSITITGPPGGASYKWTGPCIPGPDNQQVVKVTCAGLYSLVTTSSAGVSCIDTFKINILPSPGGPPPTPSFTANKVCAGTPTQFTNTSTPASGTGVKFYWDFYNIGQFNDSTTNPSWIFPAGGYYKVRLHQTNNGCESDTIITIAVDSVNTYSIPNVTPIPANTTSCQSCDGKIDLKVKLGLASKITITNNFNSGAPTFGPGGSASSGAGNCGSILGGGFATIKYCNLCPGTYYFYVKLSNPSPATKCSPASTDDTIQVVINPTGVNITTNITITPATCGNNNGSTTITGLGGTAPYTYTWSNANVTATNTNLSAGTYTVTVKDANGCMAKASAKILSLTQIPASAIPFDVKCYGDNNGSVKVKPGAGAAPFTYSWSPVVSTVDSAVGLAPGNYSITVTDMGGCSGSTAVTIKQPTQLRDSISAFTNVNCAIKGSATVGVKGGAPPYLYNWSNGGNSKTDTALAPGSYTVTVSDGNACTVTTSVLITQSSAISANVNSTPANCGLSNGTATATANGGILPYTYAWLPSGGTAPTAVNLSAGTYTVIVTDSKGCGNNSSVTIAVGGLPSIIVQTVNNASCVTNGSATIAASGGAGMLTYSWSPSGGTNATANNLSAGIYTVVVKDTNNCSSSTTVTISLPTNPQLTTTKVDDKCGKGTGSASVTASAGTGAYTYLWTPGGMTTSTANALTANNYTVSVTDSQGCTATSAVIIADQNGPVPLTTSTDVTCYGESNGTAQVTANGGTTPYTYIWQPSAGTTSSISNLSSGTYTINVTDMTGCTGTSTVSINQPTQITISAAVTNAKCNTSNGSIVITAVGGTGILTSAWMPSGGSGLTASNLSAGYYTVTITDAASCTLSSTVLVANSGIPAISVGPINNISCNGGSDGAATITVTGGSPGYTINWMPVSAGTGTTINSLSAGIYTVNVSDSNGCTEVSSVTITEPPPLTLTIPPVGKICIGQNTALTVTAGGGTPGYSYAWAPGGLTNSSINVNPTITTTYSVAILDSKGCTSSSQVKVDVASPLQVNTAGGISVCTGDSTTVMATASGGDGNYTYSWQPGNATGSAFWVTPVGNITYTVTVSDGCSTPSATSIVTVRSSNALLTPAFTPDSTFGCAPLCVKFVNVTSGGISKNCRWEFGDGGSSQTCNPTYCYRKDGTYSVKLTVTDSNGCASSLTKANIIQVYPLPTAAFSSDPKSTSVLTPLVNFTDRSSSDVVKWDWNLGDVPGSSSTKKNPIYTYKDTGRYEIQLIVTTAYGCMDTVIDYLLIHGDYMIYVPNSFSPNGDEINETFFPKGFMIDPNCYKMLIFDRWGNEIFQTTDINSGWNGKANGGIETAQQDIYVWRIETCDYLKVRHLYVGHVTLVK